MPRPTKDSVVTIREAAAALGRSERTIYAWVADDRLASAKGADGALRIRYGDAVEVESRIRRGRPRRDAPRKN